MLAKLAKRKEPTKQVTRLTVKGLKPYTVRTKITFFVKDQPIGYAQS